MKYDRNEQRARKFQRDLKLLTTSYRELCKNQIITETL